jgi:hypothetical protein
MLAGFVLQQERARRNLMEQTRSFGSELARVALSLTFVLLVALFFAILISAALAIFSVQSEFPASRLFLIAFANLIAVYAAIFSVFVDQIFTGVEPYILSIGFALPILFFVAGCWLRREEVRAVVAHPAIRSERRLFGALAWLLPTSLVGVSVFFFARPLGHRQYRPRSALCDVGDRADCVHREP